MISKLIFSLVVGILTIGAYVSIAIEKIRKIGEKK